MSNIYRYALIEALINRADKAGVVYSDFTMFKLAYLNMVEAKTVKDADHWFAMGLACVRAWRRWHTK